MNIPQVIVERVTFRYAREQQPVFSEFTWHVERGEAWAVVGPSGCGKSTLLYLLAGLRQPTSGQILVEGTPVPRPRASTGLILQNHGLLPWATVRENAALGLRIGHFYARKRTSSNEPRPYPPVLPLSEADVWLERLNIAGVRDKYPTQISGGQQQRVAIARTLVLRPTLLLMDEPFSALDAFTREGLQDLVAELQNELEMTTIVVTHNVEEAAFLGKRILVLGPIPNRQPLIVENPGAGVSGWRNSGAFSDIVHALRKLLTPQPSIAKGI